LGSFTPEVGRSGEVVECFHDEKHASDTALDSNKRCPSVCGLTLTREALIRHALVHLLLGRGTLVASVEAVLRRCRS
jgi:hypothetical protein